MCRPATSRFRSAIRSSLRFGTIRRPSSSTNCAFRVDLHEIEGPPEVLHECVHGRDFDRERFAFGLAELRDLLQIGEERPSAAVAPSTAELRRTGGLADCAAIDGDAIRKAVYLG